MPGELVYVAAEDSPYLTPDALAVMLRQGGMACRVEKGDDGDVDLVLDADQTALLLSTDGNGYVESIVVDVTFVDERANAPRVCELLDSMGWLPADDE